MTGGEPNDNLVWPSVVTIDCPNGLPRSYTMFCSRSDTCWDRRADLTAPEKPANHLSDGGEVHGNLDQRRCERLRDRASR
jgi:hypothetical protein